MGDKLLVAVINQTRSEVIERACAWLSEYMCGLSESDLERFRKAMGSVDSMEE